MQRFLVIYVKEASNFLETITSVPIGTELSELLTPAQEPKPLDDTAFDDTICNG